MRYTLLCDDNFHYMDETERIALGEFESAEAAIAAASRVIDRDLLQAYKPGMTADELFKCYTSFGSSFVPMIALVRFPHGDYARSRRSQICAPERGLP